MNLIDDYLDCYHCSWHGWHDELQAKPDHRGHSYYCPECGFADFTKIHPDDIEEFING